MMACGAASLGSAGVRVRISPKVCTMCTPFRLFPPPAHFTQRQSSCKAGADHQARPAGARGGEGSVPGVLERRGEDVDMRSWWGWRCLVEGERRWRGLGVEDGYGRRGVREGEVDIGRQWRAWCRLGEQEWWWRGLELVDGYWWRGERGAWRGLWGEGGVDVGRRLRASQRQGERERWWRGLGVGVVYGRGGGGGGGHGAAVALVVAPGGAGAARAGSRGVVVAPEGAGAARVGGLGAVAVWGLWAPGASVPCGGGAGAPPFGGLGLIARVGPVRRRWRVLGGLAWCCLVPGGGRGPLSSMDPPRRGVLAASAGSMGRVTVPGGVGPGGPLRRGRGGRGDTFPGTGGLAGTGGVASSGRWGMRVERSVATISSAGAVRAQGVVARWCRVVGSGSGGGGVGGCGGGACGGGGVGSGGVGVAGLALGPLVGIPVTLVGVGGRASCAAPGAVLCG